MSVEFSLKAENEFLFIVLGLSLFFSFHIKLCRFLAFLEMMVDQLLSSLF